MRITGPDMKQPGKKVFTTSRHVRIEALLKLLEKQFIVEESDSSTEQRIYYDTFDWRLYRENLIFYRCGNRLILQKKNGLQVASAVGRNRNKYFWWDIGVGEMQEKLQDCLEMRALCPIVSVESTINEFRVMNHERKTVARIGLQSDVIDGSDDPDPTETIVVEEIRGYDVPYQRVLQNCRELGLEKVGKKSDADRMLKQSGRIPGGYGDKFTIDLDKTISVGEAVSKICLHLLEDMKVNRDGIVTDIDSEFLHDFRIAVRRTRSLISLLKKNLPEEMTDYFNGEFKWLGCVTGPVRDIDVYLLEKDDYVGLLPKSLQPGLELFFDELKQRRINELKLLQSYLTSTRYEALLEDWHRFLTNRAGDLFLGDMSENCRECADAMILKRFRIFIREGNAITEASPAEELHQLRIKGKKFRYLLEFFKSFYDKKQMAVFLKQMKNLQNNLGDYNDLSIQQGLLNEKLDSLRGKNLQTIRLAAALGGLIAVLSDKHTLVRYQFAATYDNFSNAQVQTMLKGMVNEKKRARRG